MTNQKECIICFVFAIPTNANEVLFYNDRSKKRFLTTCVEAVIFRRSENGVLRFFVECMGNRNDNIRDEIEAKYTIESKCESYGRVTTLQTQNLLDEFNTSLTVKMVEVFYHGRISQEILEQLQMHFLNL